MQLDLVKFDCFFVFFTYYYPYNHLLVLLCYSIYLKIDFALSYEQKLITVLFLTFNTLNW